MGGESAQIGHCMHLDFMAGGKPYNSTNFSSMQSGDAVLRTNDQYLSLTDQLNLGVRAVELDVHWFEVLQRKRPARPCMLPQGAMHGVAAKTTQLSEWPHQPWSRLASWQGKPTFAVLSRSCFRRSCIHRVAKRMR